MARPLCPRAPSNQTYTEASSWRTSSPRSSATGRTRRPGCATRRQVVPEDGVRKFREAADQGNVDEAVALKRAASRQLDKAASKGVIHKNQAANRKSAIAKRAAALSTAAK